MYLSNDPFLLINVNVIMYVLCQTNLILILILINVFLSESIDEFGVTDMVIDIDEDDNEKKEIADYKKIKQQRPFAFQNHTNRIVGGNKTTIEQYPFIISFQDKDLEAHMCGGSIIHKLWVLTASHCVTICVTDPCGDQTLRDPKAHRIVAGASDAQPMQYGQIRDVEKFVNHPNFRRSLLLNDIALIKIVNPFEFGKSVKVIDIPQFEDLHGKDVTSKYKECLALGWGAQKPRSGKRPEDLTEQEQAEIQDDLVSPVLMVVSLPVIPIKICMFLISPKYVTNRHMCTMYASGGRDACEGDSGGPLVCGAILYGVTSWGHGCARRNTPGVFTRVDTYTDWIQNIIHGKPNIDYYSSSNKLVLYNWVLFLIVCYQTEVF